MSVIRKQWLEQYNYSDVQSALMNGFRTDFTSSGRNFCRWVAEAPPRETSFSGDERGETSAARRLEKHAVLIETTNQRRIDPLPTTDLFLLVCEWSVDSVRGKVEGSA